MKTYKKLGLGLLGLGLLGLGVIGYETKKVAPYLKTDIQSELTRESSSGHPTSGLEGKVERTLEHVKTGRDWVLFLWNDLTDQRKEYRIIVNKKQNEAGIYLCRDLIKRIPIGTGKENKQTKTKFGEYVTPNGNYLVIHTMNKEQLEEKFGETKANKFYDNGMLQLSGPWAPHIAIHATPDSDKIGAYKSNGCINVSPQDMTWLLENVGVGSLVVVE